jgi:urocanate hydratase
LPKEIGTVVLGRDHHDVSGTDSPEKQYLWRIPFYCRYGDTKRDGDSFRGATWVSIHNGGGVGWR